ncbi:MAG: hypothetical protein DI586_05850 [Micavibrio aeruginosavorus]|uniref:Uncharacterized protein n=1 Tax=Micavibrio aeruginosavorus TaxID=349221 RepID=A0A2W5FKQ5_9BACT|nr:MAG: hypothetical protein DI586_05850 [Micavibrio aeruginosavorus]
MQLDHGDNKGSASLFYSFCRLLKLTFVYFVLQFFSIFNSQLSFFALRKHRYTVRLLGLHQVPAVHLGDGRKTAWLFMTKPNA